MDDQLIDKMADAIIISMVKHGAFASSDNLAVKQAAIVGPGSWMAAGMQAMRNGLNPQQIAQLKSNAGKGGMIGAGIGTALGMIRGARQTARQAGGWGNASFGQYVKNIAGQGAVGGIGGSVMGAGAGAMGTYGKNIYNAAKEIHGNDLRDIAAGQGVQNIGNKAQAASARLQNSQQALQNSVRKNQEAVANSKQQQGFFGRLFGWGNNAKTIRNANEEIGGAQKALDKVQGRKNQLADRYQENFNTEAANLQNYIQNRGNIASNMSTLPANYLQNVMDNAQQNINNYRNIKDVELPGAYEITKIKQRNY